MEGTDFLSEKLYEDNFFSEDEKAILDTFTDNLIEDYEDIYDELEDEIKDLYWETGLDPMEF